MDTVFKIRNNSARSIGFAGKLCIAGSGCVTPEKVAQQTNFRLPDYFVLTEDEVFRAHRGLAASMKNRQPGANSFDIEVFIPGVEKPLTEDDLMQWVGEYRSKHGLAAPTTPFQHHKEAELSMKRPEDWIVRQEREKVEAAAKAQSDRDGKMVATVVESVLKVLEERERARAAAPVQRAEPRR